MTEPRVAAGDRALETAREWEAYYETQQPAWTIGEVHLDKLAALIQSAMNAQEREHQQTVDLLDAELGRSVAEAKEFAEALRQLVDHSRKFKNGWMGAGVLEEHLANAERLLAEREETK